MKKKEIEMISTGAGHTAIGLGAWDNLGDYVLELPGFELRGKVFVGQAAGATGAEMSFQRFEPGAETGFLHTHATHEELYVILSGRGEFQVDGTVFPLSEGSVVRVAPAGRRSLRNTSDAPLTMLCIQYKAASFGPDDAADATILPDKVVW